ncbi:hypothetical protein ACHWQZ_G016616 [Mnemiopsis leidyi]
MLKMDKLIEQSSVVQLGTDQCCEDEDLSTHDLALLRSNTKLDNSEQKGVDGYDSGLGSSPHNPLSVPGSHSPPQSLPLNVNIKPKTRRRKRGSSTTASGFDDHFERTGRILGEGAFSRVEVCKDRKTHKEYAVKIIQKENWYTRTRVLQEVEILYRGRGHPNIIQLEQYFEGDSQFFLVFEMMRGGALINHIESHKMFTEREAAIVVQCVTSALKHLHAQGIAHRDLKFENILCGDNFTDVKICDFDLGGQKLDCPYLSTPLMDSPVGSAEFMAPEVVSLFEGHRTTYDKSCDMWSLGVLIYIMIYGKPPFTGRCGLNCGWDIGEECRECQDSLFRNITTSKLHFDENITVSDSVRDLISRLLQKNAQCRLTAPEVLEHEWVKSGGNDNRLFTPQQLKRNKSSAINLHSFSSLANEHVRRINSNQSLTSSQVSSDPDVDPLDRALQNIDLDMGESWYDEEDDDIFSDPDHTLSEFYSPASQPYCSPPAEPSPPTPTDFNDCTPVQTRFVFPVEQPSDKVSFYISSDDES